MNSKISSKYIHIESQAGKLYAILQIISRPQKFLDVEEHAKSGWRICEKKAKPQWKHVNTRGKPTKIVLGEGAWGQPNIYPLKIDNGRTIVCGGGTTTPDDYLKNPWGKGVKRLTHLHQ